MATSSFSTNPLLKVGTWVQLNMQSPFSYAQQGSPYQLSSAYPTVEERTIGLVRSAYVAQGTQFYQIVWNPGGSRPETGLYTIDQLSPLTTQQAQQIQSEMAAGTYTPQGGWQTNAG